MFVILLVGSNDSILRMKMNNTHITMILQLSDGGKAANANVGIGDVVLSIDGISAEGMTHLEAQNRIKTCSGNLLMNLQR